MPHAVTKYMKILFVYRVFPVHVISRIESIGVGGGRDVEAWEAEGGSKQPVGLKER